MSKLDTSGMQRDETRILRSAQRTKVEPHGGGGVFQRHRVIRIAGRRQHEEAEG